MRVTLAAIYLALVMASSASAATGHRPPGVSLPPATEEAKLAAYLDVARSYWPGSRCAGREVVRLRADEEIARIRPDVPGARGVALVGACEVLLREGLTADTFCLVLAHELGHLAGRDHANETGIMSPNAPAVGSCVAATASATRGRDWYATLALLPNGGRGWHVAPFGAGRAVASSPAARCRRLIFFGGGEGQVVVGRCRPAGRR